MLTRTQPYPGYTDISPHPSFTLSVTILSRLSIYSFHLTLGAPALLMQMDPRPPVLRQGRRQQTILITSLTYDVPEVGLLPRAPSQLRDAPSVGPSFWPD